MLKKLTAKKAEMPKKKLSELIEDSDEEADNELTANGNPEGGRTWVS